VQLLATWLFAALWYAF